MNYTYSRTLLFALLLSTNFAHAESGSIRGGGRSLTTNNLTLVVEGNDTESVQPGGGGNETESILPGNETEPTPPPNGNETESVLPGNITETFPSVGNETESISGNNETETIPPAGNETESGGVGEEEKEEKEDDDDDDDEGTCVPLSEYQ